MTSSFERPNEYLLLVEWDSLEAHEVGFRKSQRHAEWKALLHSFSDPFPTVSHSVDVELDPPPTPTT